MWSLCLYSVSKEHSNNEPLSSCRISYTIYSDIDPHHTQTTYRCHNTHYNTSVVSIQSRNSYGDSKFKQNKGSAFLGFILVVLSLHWIQEGQGTTYTLYLQSSRPVPSRLKTKKTKTI